jgi:uncharacterized protein YecT (DUF1311 family)
MRTWLLIAFGFLALTPLPATAQCKDTEGTRDSIYANCLRPALEDASRKMRAEINRIVERAKTNALTKDTIALEQLVKSQAQWEQFRDSHCEAIGIMKVGGQSSRLIPETECQIRLTKQRTIELRGVRKLLQ